MNAPTERTPTLLEVSISDAIRRAMQLGNEPQANALAEHLAALPLLLRPAPKPREFEYLLNAMELAAQQDKPADHDYGAKRKAVLGYVASLIADRPIADAARAYRDVEAKRDAAIKAQNWNLETARGHSNRVALCREAVDVQDEMFKAIAAARSLPERTDR